ncbi:MAG: hypothetical protein IIB57_03975 [Planctomycetes bacterium]|nr:hypothetical protein [Planctomycetota bacterium]
MARNFGNSENDRAFQWLTQRDSMQAAMLEEAMRNYAHPVYDPADVGTHLMRALSAPMAKYAGDPTQVDAVLLAVAVIDYSCQQGWDVVEEIGSSS